MQQVDSNGDVVFSSTEFGSGSVTKVGQIAEILRALLSEITLTTSSRDTELILADYYKKSEITQLLLEYAKLADLQTQIETLVNAALSEVDFDQLRDDLDSLDRVVSQYSTTIQTIVGNQESVQAQVTGFSQTIAAWQQSVSGYEDRFTTISSNISSINTVLNSLNLINLAQFSTDVSGIQDDISTLQSQVQSLQTKIGASASLCTYDRPALLALISNLRTAINSIPSSAISTANKNSCIGYLDSIDEDLADSNDLSAGDKLSIVSSLNSIKSIISSLGTNASFSATDRSNLVSSIESIITTVNAMDADSSIDTTDLVKYMISLLSKIKANSASINSVDAKIGTLSSLSTENKSNIVLAINELFTSASNGKSLIAAAITGKGITAAASESFQQLATKIGSIPTGGSTPQFSYYSNHSAVQPFSVSGAGYLLLGSLDINCSECGDPGSGTIVITVDGVRKTYFNDYNQGDVVQFNTSVTITGENMTTIEGDADCRCDTGVWGVSAEVWTVLT